MALGPLVRWGARARRARLFHADGVILRAEVVPAVAPPGLAALAARLGGPALVRLSSAFFRGHGARRPDVLGAALRLTARTDAGPAPAPGDQDLLLATVRRPWTLLPALLTTDRRDWLSNTYFGTVPYEADGVEGRLRLRLRPAAPAPGGGNRLERVLRAVEEGGARLTLEVRRVGRGHGRTWVPLAQVHLQERVAFAPGALRFWPFRDGRGLRPVGFIHGTRAGPYAQSQRGWPGTPRPAHP